MLVRAAVHGVRAAAAAAVRVRARRRARRDGRRDRVRFLAAAGRRERQRRPARRPPAEQRRRRSSSRSRRGRGPARSTSASIWADPPDRPRHLPLPDARRRHDVPQNIGQLGDLRGADEETGYRPAIGDVPTDRYLIVVDNWCSSPTDPGCASPDGLRVRRGDRERGQLRGRGPHRPGPGQQPAARRRAHRSDERHRRRHADVHGQRDRRRADRELRVRLQQRRAVRVRQPALERRQPPLRQRRLLQRRRPGPRSGRGHGVREPEAS